MTSFGVLRMPWAANITVHAFQVLINNSLLFEALYVIVYCVCRTMDPNSEVRLTCSYNDNLGESVLDLLCTVNDVLAIFIYVWILCIF